jgi:zinc transport system substrate-binding protein
MTPFGAPRRGRRSGGHRSGSLLAGALAAGLSLAGLTACGSDSSGSDGGKPSVVTSFYPLQYVTERIAGDTISISSLTKPGAEPHGLELTPKDIASVHDADLVVYLSKFQSAVDDAVSSSGGSKALDVAVAARLGPSAGTAQPSEGEHDHGDTDPHFWLDPTRLADVADAVAAQLKSLAPEHAEAYTTNAAALHKELLALDAEFAGALKTCTSRELVTSHEAFGYLAERYGFVQHGITGLVPEEEPGAAAIAEIVKLVRTKKIRTVYYEVLVNPDIARTVASEAKVTTSVLDPVASISDKSAAQDYPGVMRVNLASLVKGQGCS